MYRTRKLVYETFYNIGLYFTRIGCLFSCERMRERQKTFCRQPKEHWLWLWLRLRLRLRTPLPAAERAPQHRPRRSPRSAATSPTATVRADPRRTRTLGRTDQAAAHFPQLSGPDDHRPLRQPTNQPTNQLHRLQATGYTRGIPIAKISPRRSGNIASELPRPRNYL